MTYSYNSHLAPKVGGGLPGLPRRRDTKVVTTPERTLYQGQTPRLVRVGGIVSTPSISSSYLSDMVAFPLPGMAGKTLLVEYNQAHVVEYGDDGMNILFSQTNNSWVDIDHTAVVWDDSTIIYGESYLGTSTIPPRFYKIAINHATNSITAGLMFTVPLTGTLDSGEAYECYYSQQQFKTNRFTQSSAVPVVMSSRNTLVAFPLIRVGGIPYLGFCEFTVNGEIVKFVKTAAMDLVYPSLNTSRTYRSITIQLIGEYFHLHWQDGSTSASAHAKAGYLTIRGDGDQWRDVYIAATSSGISPETRYNFMFSDDKSVMFGRLSPRGSSNSSKFQFAADYSFLLALNTDGSIKSATLNNNNSPNYSGDRLFPYYGDLVGANALETYDQLSFGQLFQAYSGGPLLPYKGAVDIPLMRLDHAANRGIFAAPVDNNAAVNTSFNIPNAWARNYQTVVDEGVIMVTIKDSVQPTMVNFLTSNDSRSFGEDTNISLKSYMPLGGGFWIGGVQSYIGSSYVYGRILMKEAS